MAVQVRFARAETPPAEAGVGQLMTQQEATGGMPATGHATGTLIADSQFLYVSVGSGSNQGVDSSRARVVRFALVALGKSPVAFGTGELFADGLRNNVAWGLTSTAAYGASRTDRKTLLAPIWWRYP